MDNGKVPLFEVPDNVGVRSPWVLICGDPRPYSIRRPTAKQPFRLEVLRCTRPARHGGLLHEYAEVDRGTIAQWDRGGEPVWPPVIKAAGAHVREGSQ